MDFEKLISLGKRVYNGKMVEEKDAEGNITLSDEKDIKALCSKVFGDGSVNPDPSLLHNFNNIIVKLADVIAQPRVDEMMSILANYQKANRGDIIAYKVPEQNRVFIKWTALGSGVDLVRINPREKKVPAIPKQLQFGASYEPLDMVQNSVEGFRTAVNAVADAKVEFYYTKIVELIQKAVTSQAIPTTQVLSSANISITDYKALENKMIRLGGRPIMIGDMALVNHFSEQQVTDAYYSKLLTDRVKEGLLSDLRATAFSKTVAININNPFIDKSNSKVRFAVNEGYVFAGAEANKAPFYITEFGGMRQTTEQDAEDERIKMVIKLEADITLLSGRAMGYIKDTSVVL